MSKRNLKQNEPFFDDCPVCQAMKKMGISQKPLDSDSSVMVTPVHPKQAEALKSAFQQTRKKGFMVGGSMFED